jgi:hypothetical protein
MVFNIMAQLSDACHFNICNRYGEKMCDQTTDEDLVNPRRAEADKRFAGFMKEVDALHGWRCHMWFNTKISD